MIYELIDDVAAALAELPQAHPRRGALEMLAAALLRESRFLQQYPTETLPYLRNVAHGHAAPGAGPTRPAAGVARDGPLEEVASRWLDERQVRRPMLRSTHALPAVFDKALAVVFRGHTGQVAEVSFSPDGHRLATAGSEGNVRLWKVDNGQELLRLADADAGLTCVAFSPDGRLIAAGEVSRSESPGKFVGSAVRLWDAESGTLVGTIRGHGAGVTCLAWSADGRWLASGSNGGTVRVDDIAAQAEVRVLRARDLCPTPFGYDVHPLKVQVAHLAFSPDGRYLALRSGNSRVQLLDVAGNFASSVKFEYQCISNIAFSPDGSRLAFGLYEKCIGIVEIARPEAIRKLDVQSARVEAVAWSPDGKQIASGAWDGVICVWDATTGALLYPLGSEQSSVRALVWSSDGTRLASASLDTARLWQASVPAAQATHVSYDRDVVQIAFAPSGDRLAAARNDETVVLRTLPGGEEIRCLISERPFLKRLFGGPAASLEEFARARATGAVEDYLERLRTALEGRWRKRCGPLCFSPDGRRIAISEEDNIIGLWDTSTGEQVDLLVGHDRRVTSLSFAPDGARLAGCAPDSPVFLWDAASGREAARLNGPSTTFKQVLWSTRGHLLAGLADNGVVRLWDAGTLKVLHDLAPHAPVRLDYRVDDTRRLAFSADDVRLVHWEPSWWGAQPNPSFLTIWDVTTGRLSEHSTPAWQAAERFLAQWNGMTIFPLFERLGTEVRSTSGDELVAAFHVRLIETQTFGNRYIAGASRADLYVLELEPGDLDL